MNKILVVVFFICCGYSISYGQLELKPGIGLNASRFNTDPSDDFGSISGRTGWQFGGSLLFGNKWYIEPGLYMVHQGNELQTIDMNSQEVNFKNDINSMLIPVLFGYHLLGKQKGLFGFRVFAGPSLQLVTAVSSEIPDVSIDDFESSIWAMNTGMGFDIWLLFLDFNYQWDLTKTFSNPDEDAKNHVIKANLGARIKF